MCTEWRFASEGRRVAACLCAAVDLVLTSSASLAEYGIHETKACCWIPLHKKSGNRLKQMNAKEHRLRGLERKAEQKKKSKAWSDLWVSSQQSRLAPLSWREHKSCRRCGEQRHNSGSPLQSNDWGDNVSQEPLCPSCRFFPRYCHSHPFVFFFSPLAVFFLPVSLAVTVWLLCSAELMPFRGQMSQRRGVFRHSAPHLLFCAWTATACVLLSKATSLSLLLFLHSHGFNFKVLWA